MCVCAKYQEDRITSIELRNPQISQTGHCVCLFVCVCVCVCVCVFVCVCVCVCERERERDTFFKLNVYLKYIRDVGFWF